MVESDADASFAAGENEKSHSGAVVVWGDCPVMWATQRQSTVALSTAEAELHASIEGATMIQSCGEEALQKVLYTDSVSTCSILFSTLLAAGGPDIYESEQLVLGLWWTVDIW